jgi:hypothetical protein
MKGGIKIAKVACMGLVLNLAACASMQTAIEHKDLSGGSQLSHSIILEPVPNSQKTVHVSIKNTSDQQIKITNKVKSAIESHGYKVVSNPNHAHYLLQANILKVGKMSKSASKAALGGGYGSIISGAVGGAAIGGLTNSANTAIGGAILGSAASFVADSLVKDVNYVMITDVLVSERTKVAVNEKTQSNLTNGTSSQTIQSSSGGTHWQKYRTRVVSNADKVNLKFAEARPVLENSLAKVISGIF